MLRLTLVVMMLTAILGTTAASADEDPPAERREKAALKAERCPAQPDIPGPDPNGYEENWLDDSRDIVYRTVCSTGLWFDQLFARGKRAATDEYTYGSLRTGLAVDRYEGFDPALRLRARVPLPAFNNRLRLLIGRGYEREAVEDRDAWAGRAIPQAFRQVDDPGWLVGLGYGSDTRLAEGWEFDAGVRVKRHPDAIGKGVYRKDVPWGEAALVRFRETLFWRASRGLGTTTQLTIDRLLLNLDAPESEFMVRWSAAGTFAEDVKGLEWDSSLALYQDLPEARWLSYSVLIRGETGDEVSLKDYGFELRYRRPVFRPWLFMQASTSLTWPRETLEEKREINPGVGIEFEMYFGHVPEMDMR